MIHSVTLRVLVGTFLVTSCLAATPLFAANKDIDRLAIQIAALQGQIAEIQRANDEARAELKRLAELVAEQNALLRKGATDRRQQDEAVSVGLRELGERVSELAEALEAIKTQTALSLPAPTDPVAQTAVGAAAPVPGAPPAPAVPTQAPRELYSQAYADYARGNYDLAMQGFAEYLRAYPDRLLERPAEGLPDERQAAGRAREEGHGARAARPPQPGARRVPLRGGPLPHLAGGAHRAGAPQPLRERERTRWHPSTR